MIQCEQKCLLEDMFFFFSGWCYIDFSLKSMRPQGQIKISPSKGFLTDGRSSSSTDRWLHWQGGSGGTHHRSHSHSFWSGWKDPLQTLQQMWLDRRFADDLQQEGRVTWNQQVNETRDRCKLLSMRDLSIEESNGRGSREGLHNHYLPLFGTELNSKEKHLDHDR